MSEKLAFIASNLDCYHFRTDGARALKREIQAWSVLPKAEQPAAARNQKLQERFDSMFANNPFLEWHGFVPEAEITGAAAEAYYFPGEDGECCSLLPEAQPPESRGTELTDRRAEELKKQWLSVGTEEHMQLDADWPEAGMRMLSAVRDHTLARFEHVLRKTSPCKELGKTPSEVLERTLHSPGILAAVLCILFYILTAQRLQWLFQSLLLDRAALAAQPLTAVVTLVSLAVAVSGFCDLMAVKTVVFGVYRSLTALRLKAYGSRMKKKAKSAVERIDPAEWCSSFLKMARRDSETLSRCPDTPPGKLENRRCLAAPQKTVAKLAGADLTPWALYPRNGADRMLWRPLLCLIALLAVS